MLKNYLEFGSIKNKQKRRYEIKKGNLYDWYMLPRYFNDLHILDKFSKSNNFKKLAKKLHHKEDLKFNFTILLLLKVSKFKIFYEFGQTLFEKIYFLKVFSNYFKIRNLRKTRWRGNDISEMFNFFCNNFYKNLDVKVFNKLDKKSVKNSSFFAKGVTLLYIKNNINVLNNVINKSESGSFDISLVKKKNNVHLNTGKILYFPTIKEFDNLIKNSNKQFLFRNIKVENRNKIYLEVIYGRVKIINKYLKELDFYNKKLQKNKFVRNLLGLNLKVRKNKYY